MCKGDAIRAMGATDCNERSSRSHAILSFHVESQRVSHPPASSGAGAPSLGRSGGKGGGGGVRLGKLHLVDLAGRWVCACFLRVMCAAAARGNRWGVVQRASMRIGLQYCWGYLEVVTWRCVVGSSGKGAVLPPARARACVV